MSKDVRLLGGCEMRLCSTILGAAYIGPYGEWNWVQILGVLLAAVMLFWILYVLVLSRIDWKGKKKNKSAAIERVVITGYDAPDESGITPICVKEEDIESEEVIVMPFSGELMELSKVPDPIFSEKMVGDGFAVRPSKGEIVSPVNGHVQKIQSNNALITFQTSAGREVILHIGLNVPLEGHAGISLDVKEGDSVKAGKHIGNVNLDQMVLKVNSIISPIVFPALKEKERVVVKQQGIVEAGMEDIVVIEINQ